MGALCCPYEKETSEIKVPVRVTGRIIAGGHGFDNPVVIIAPPALYFGFFTADNDPFQLFISPQCDPKLVPGIKKLGATFRPPLIKPFGFVV